jgi:hypothetical protein
MEFDTTSLMLSLIFGSIGLGFFLYGKKAGQLVPICAGAALMIFPYLIPNIAILLIVCLILSVVPFIIREA